METGILYALHIRRQKYGFYPIFLLNLQVGLSIYYDYQKGIENILADDRIHRCTAFCRGTDLTDAASPDIHCRQGRQCHQRQARRRHTVPPTISLTEFVNVLAMTLLGLLSKREKG